MAAPSSSTDTSSMHDGRSRNARAQARHREKRKAYIAQLEDTVSKLQAAMALTTEQAAALPSPQARLRELQVENSRLRAEIDQLRRQLPNSPASAVTAPHISPSSGSSDELPYAGSFAHHCNHSSRTKRRRAHEDVDDDPVLRSQASSTNLRTPSSRSDSLSRPASQPMASLRPPNMMAQQSSAMPSNYDPYNQGSNYHRGMQLPASSLDTAPALHRIASFGDSHAGKSLAPGSSYMTSTTPRPPSLQTSFSQGGTSYPQSAPPLVSQQSAGLSDSHHSFPKQEDDDHTWTQTHHGQQTQSSFIPPPAFVSTPTSTISSSYSPSGNLANVGWSQNSAYQHHGRGGGYGDARHHNPHL